MVDADKLMLQLCYAAALVDAANNYALFDGAGKIAEKKAREQSIAAPQQLNRFGAKTPAEVLKRMMNVFGCTEWHIDEETEHTTRAVTSTCLMCTIAKKTGAVAPCGLYCIGPMKAYGKALQPAYDLRVEETLWEGNACRFVFDRP